MARTFLLPALLAFALLLPACNPFAPALQEGDPLADLLGDPTTIDGFFTRFRTAYELRDLGLYEPLLDSSFVFVYYDYDVQIERSWGFAQEVESTRRLFMAAADIRLSWNQTLVREVSPSRLSAQLVRSFTLNVALDDGQEFRTTGNANFQLARPDSTLAWRLVRWRDESEL